MKKKKILGVGSILRKEERKRRKNKEILNFKNGEPTHYIKEVRDENGIIVGYVECADKSTVKVPIKKLEAPLFFGVGNEEYVANGMEEDMLRAEKLNKEVEEAIDRTIAKARHEDNIELSPRIVNGKIISMNLCVKKGDGNCEK